MRQPLQMDHGAPWKRRYRVVRTWTRIARANPRRGLAVSNRSGVFQLYAWNVDNGDLRQLTDRPTGIVNGTVAADGAYVYYLDDHHGNEIGHYVRVPFEGGAPEDITPDLPHYSSFSFDTSRAGDRIGFQAAHDGAYAFYVIDAANSAVAPPREVYRSSKLAFGPLLSADGTIGVIATTERSGALHYSLIALDLERGTRLQELSDGDAVSVEARLFSPITGDARLLATTNRRGVTQPLIWDARSGERVDLELDDLQGDVLPQDWSPDGRWVLLKQVHQATQRLYCYDLTTHTLRRLDPPAGTLEGAYFVDPTTIFAHWQDSTQPLQLIALDAATGHQRRVIIPASDVPPGRRWRSVQFPSSDGQLIQGWLAIPDGAGPFPTILETHGGPSAVQTEVFSPNSQAWLEHGFAFLTINYRGSTTFGKAFQEQIWGDLGHWEVEDLVAAHAFLVTNGIARPDAIFLTGWSYGGYLTLMGLGKRPNLWAGGMAGIAIADWTTQYEDTVETLRGYQVALLGGTPEAKPEQYAVSSPISYVEQFAAPVLVIQGSNDTRCPARPMRLFEEQMRAHGKDITVHWFEAGHGSYAIEEEIEHQERMLRFAYRVLGY